jgi:hypothetical protein
MDRQPATNRDECVFGGEAGMVLVERLRLQAVERGPKTPRHLARAKTLARDVARRGNPARGMATAQERPPIMAHDDQDWRNW